MARPNARPTVQIDNERTRVTEWRFEPGAATGWHRHDYDYVVVPMTSGILRLEEEGGVHDAQLTVGQTYFRNAGVEHDVINANPHEFVFVEIELKTTSPQLPAKNSLSASADGKSGSSERRSRTASDAN